MTELLHHQDFEPYVGKPFDFGGRTTLHLALIDVRHHAIAPDTTRTPFTLIFHGPTGDVLQEGLYEAAIEGGTTLTFYVMPIHTTTAGRQEYQAVFN